MRRKQNEAPLNGTPHSSHAACFLSCQLVAVGRREVAVAWLTSVRGRSR